MNARSDWWNDFFKGPAVRLWLQALSADQTRQESDRLARLLEIPAGGEILDVPCGAGRVALALNGLGYRLTGVDLSPEFLAHAMSADPARRVVWERRDMRDLPWPSRFDGAVCVGNSFGYLDDAGNADFLRAVRTALRPGGRFILQTPMVLENLLGHLQPRPWWKVGDIRLLAENRYDATTGRLEIEYTFVGEGEICVRRGSHRAYSYRELVELIRGAGFDVAVAEPWTRDSHDVTFIATAR